MSNRYLLGPMVRRYFIITALQIEESLSRE